MCTVYYSMYFHILVPCLILHHRIPEIVLWGNSDNGVCKAPEACSSISLYIPTYKYIY